MHIFRHYTELPKAYLKGVIALGNFDGLHLGHQKVISQALSQAALQKCPCLVMSFEPHPREFFQSHLQPLRLTPMRVKARLIQKRGVDALILQHFDHAFAAKSAHDFCKYVLVQALQVQHVIIGYDYCFGANRLGTPELLMSLGKEYDFSVTIVPAVKDEKGALLSSSKIREALKIPDLTLVKKMLGREWEIEGHVEKGDQRGRQLGFPTANIALKNYVRPCFGVYVVRVFIQEEQAWYEGIANLGRRPTFAKEQDLLEVNLFNYSGNLYSKHLRVSFLHFLRPEMKFSSLQALQNQIKNDSLKAHSLLTNRD